MTRTQTELNILPAYNGDSILIKTYVENNEEFIILVDGGTSSTFEYTLKKNLNEITKIDLLILSHIDSDHIGGLISFFKNSLIENIEIGEIWYNQPDVGFFKSKTEKTIISVPQAEDWKTLIKQKKPSVIINEITTQNTGIIIKDLEFTILSPTLEIKNKLYKAWLKQRDKLKDKQLNSKVMISTNTPSYSKALEELSNIDFKPEKSINNDIYNSSSIAFLLKCPDLSILLLADSRAEIVGDSLKKLGFSETKPLEVDFVKISHHGSLNNTSQELLSFINSNNYLISTNGGTSIHKHPSRETIARIVYNTNRTDDSLNIYTNYKVDTIKERIGDFISPKDLEKGNWRIDVKNTFTKNDK
jgi:beta-lactamase superfamily II metal-dependent hydrolase